jgi:hypothetical protein
MASRIVQNASRAAGRNVGLPAEGSRMRKINGKYYLSNITWPRDGMRTQLIFRADTLTGPFEGRAALQRIAWRADRAISLP